MFEANDGPQFYRISHGQSDDLKYLKSIGDQEFTNLQKLRHRSTVLKQLIALTAASFICITLAIGVAAFTEGEDYTSLVAFIVLEFVPLTGIFFLCWRLVGTNEKERDLISRVRSREPVAHSWWTL